MKVLGIDPMSIDEIFISHAHLDHTGGLLDILNVNKKAIIYIPPSFSINPKREIRIVKEATRIHENVFSTGEIDNIEQSLIIKTNRGLALIVGCSHPKMSHILRAASKFGRVCAIVGGLHGFDEFELFRDMKFICHAHCTQHKDEIKSLYYEKYIDGGVGRVIVL